VRVVASVLDNLATELAAAKVGWWPAHSSVRSVNARRTRALAAGSHPSSISPTMRKNRRS